MSVVQFAVEEDFDLGKEAILVKVKISQVGVTANSKRLSREAAAAHEADGESVKGYVQKIRWADLSALTRVYNEAKALLKEKTLPWSEEYRLCPVSSYDELTKGIRALEVRFNDEVTKLVRRHSELETNYRERVKDLADEVRFPTAEQMKASFSFSFEESLIPSTDVRLNHVSSEARMQITAHVKAQMAEQLATAQKEIAERLATVVERIVKGASEGGKLHSSALTALTQTLDTVKTLNLANDPEVTALIEKTQTELGGIDASDLKGDTVAKQAVAAKAGNILSDLRGFSSKK